MAKPEDLVLYRTTGGLGGPITPTKIENQDMISWDPSTIAGITLSDIAAINAYDLQTYPQGTLRYVYGGTPYVQWKAPGGDFGLQVDLDGDGTFKVTDGIVESKYIIIDVVTASLPTSSVDQDIGMDYLSNVLFDDVDTDESEVGDTEYRGFILKNDGVDIMTNVIAYIDTSDVPSLPLIGDYDSSGAFYLDVGDTTEYPLNGFLENEVTGEWLYFAAKASDGERLIIPSVGRGAKGTTPAAGLEGHAITYRAPVEIGAEVVSGGAITTIPSEDTAPVGVVFAYATQASALALGHLDPVSPDVDTNKYGIWVERIINPSARPIAAQKFTLRFGLDA